MKVGRKKLFSQCGESWLFSGPSRPYKLQVRDLFRAGLDVSIYHMSNPKNISLYNAASRNFFLSVYCLTCFHVPRKIVPCTGKVKWSSSSYIYLAPNIRGSVLSPIVETSLGCRH